MLSSVFKILAKKRNHFLADKMESHFYSCDPIFINIIKSLRFCSYYSLLEDDGIGALDIVLTSHTCKNKYCYICNGLKSVKLANRFNDAFNSDEHSLYFKSKSFYFLTLTLRHSLTHRNYIYLDDLNAYIQKLFRSKLFQTHFKLKKPRTKSSSISSIEITFTPSGYNIHAHILLICDKLTVPVSRLQKQIQDKWLKITEDSWNARLDLLKFEDEPGRMKALIELFKYSVKLNINQVCDDLTLHKLADWVIKSYRKKMFRTTGPISKMGIFKANYHYSDDFNGFQADPQKDYYLFPTGKIRSSEPIPLSKSRKKIIKDHPTVFIPCADQIKKHKILNVTEVSEMLTDPTDYTHSNLINSLILTKPQNEEKSQPNPIPFALGKFTPPIISSSPDLF